MAENCIPAKLQLAAVELWQRSVDAEPGRSIAYAQAESALIGGSPELGTLPQRAVTWCLALHRYEQFWADTSTTPRENTRNRAALPADERRLGEWARYQRRFVFRLSNYQLARLDVSPAFEWDPQESAWIENWRECMKHLEVAGRLPYLNSGDSHEWILARWLGRQLHAYRRGSLRSERAALLEELLRNARDSRRD